MGYLVKKFSNTFVSYKTNIDNTSLINMGTIPITLNCYNNLNYYKDGIVFIPIIASLQVVKATTPFTTGAGANDHLIISCSPGYYFFWKNNPLATIDNFIYSANYVQQTNTFSGQTYTTNVDPDKLSGVCELTNTTNQNLAGGDGSLIVNIAGYLADFN